MANKTALFSTVQPGGAFTISDFAKHPGQVFFVHAGTGTNGAGYGRDINAPFATIDYAVGNCTASKGDVIYVMPGHAETISGASSLLMDVAGIQIIGLGYGTLKPVLTFSATGSIINISEPNCRLENVRLLGAIADIVTGITVGGTADGVVLKDIEIADGGAALEFLVGIAVTTNCHDVTIDGLKFFGLGGSASAAISLAGSHDRSIIRNCILCGKWSTAAINVSGAASLDVFIYNNFVANAETGTAIGLKLNAGNTGLAAYNYLGGSKNNTNPLSDGALMHYAVNATSDLPLISGSLIYPAVTAWT